MIRLCLSIALCALAPFLASADESSRPDAFGQALEAMGISIEDLGYRPLASWSRYPHPRTTPYLLPFFEDLLAHPTDTYEFTRTLGNAVEDLLTPEALLRAPEGKERAETLFRLGVILGTDRRIGGFRGYSANLDPRPHVRSPLLHALELLRERSGQPFRRPLAFGSQYDDDPHFARGQLQRQIESIPAPLRLALAHLVLNTVQAREWIDRGLQEITPGMRTELFAALERLLDEEAEGTGYERVLDEVAGRVDEHSLHYGCLKALQATHDARRELELAWRSMGHPEREPFRLDLATPWGSVCFDNADEETPFPEHPLLVVSFRARSRIAAPLGATAAERSLSIALLLDPGERIGAAAETDLQAAGGRARLASGILGCGVLYTSGRSNQRYATGQWGLGAGLFGLGCLLDEGGDDQYEMAAAGLGAGYFGVGLLLDAEGNDRYHLYEGEGEGFGGPGGIGILADRAGDDHYYAEPDAAKAGRADYHSKHKVAANSAQGVGSGRRADGSDGHSWAGGLGALIDVEGNDRYRAGNFSQGLGYWYGTGLLWDGGGEDEYRSVYFTQGSGAHFAIGALIDEGGSDRHILEETAGAAFGFGWDVVNAFLIDRGDSDDVYDAKIISTGLGEVRSNAFFIDEGGNDRYVLNQDQKGWGDVDERDRYSHPGRTSTFNYHIGQVGLFLDLGGKDRYMRRDATGNESIAPEAGDNRVWNLRGHRSSPFGPAPNVSCGMDLEGGSVSFLAPWPARAAGD